MEKTDEDINDDTYETVKFNKGRVTKIYEINTERQKILRKRREKQVTECKS